MPAETPSRPVTGSASARSRSAQRHDEATRQVSIDAAERALSDADDDARVAPVNRSLLSIFSSTATSVGGGVVGGGQRLSDSLHGVQPQSARDVDLEAAVSASSTASTAVLHHYLSPSSAPSSPRRTDATTVDSAATTVLLLSSPSSGPRREPGVTALPHASDSCPLDAEATNAATGIGHLSPAQTTRSQHQAAVREEREEEEAVAASSLSSQSTAYTEDAAADSLSLAAVAEASRPCCSCHSRHAARNRHDGLCCANMSRGTYLLGCECKGKCGRGRCGLPLCDRPVSPIPARLLVEEKPLRSSVTAEARGKPLPAYITSLPAFNQPGRRVSLRYCHILGRGYCSFAAVLRSLGRLPHQHDNERSIAAIDAERRDTGRWIKDNWTESQWVDNVPWRHRADLWPGSSYQCNVDTMTEGTVNESLSPAFLWPTSAKQKVGVFLVVDGHPRDRAAGVELYHIGEQQAYSDYIVLMLSSGHFESCGVLTAEGRLQLRFARDSTVVKALAAACAAHARTVAAALGSCQFGPDLERQRLEQL
jgi:hypothetical protein